MMTLNGSWSFLGFLCSALIVLPATAAEVTPSAITAPLTLQGQDGKTYTLEGLAAPDLPAASATLTRLSEGQSFTATARQDRWGRIYLDAPNLNLALLREGWAQLQPEQRIPTDAERAAEANAKEARLGLWQERCCDLVDAGAAEKVTSQWRVVHGTVTAVSARRELVYVNFGPDWKTDFALLLKPALARQLKPEDWIGKTIEARGWVEWYYGPAIRITTAAQILLPAVAE